MKFLDATIRVALGYALEESEKNPGQSTGSYLFFACTRVEPMAENRQALYEELSSRIRPAEIRLQLERAIAELPA